MISALRRGQLVLRWVTVSGFNSRCKTFISVCGQPPRSTQPGHPFVRRRSEYQPKSGDALRLGGKGRYYMVRVWLADKTVWSPRYTRPLSERLSSGASHNKALDKWPDYSTLSLKIWREVFYNLLSTEKTVAEVWPSVSSTGLNSGQAAPSLYFPLIAQLFLAIRLQMHNK